VGDLLSDGAGEVRSGLWAVGFVRGFSQIEALLYETREIASTCVSGLIKGITGREKYTIKCQKVRSMIVRA
jgi:hypothetical protein